MGPVRYKDHFHFQQELQIELTRYPQGLADALTKIKNHHDVVVDTANRGMAHLFIENPLRNTKVIFQKLFNTHPDINDKINSLTKL